MIDNIVTVVFRIHFYYVTDKDLEQDLKQEGYLKAYELLSQGNYDPTKNSQTVKHLLKKHDNKLK